MKGARLYICVGIHVKRKHNGGEDTSQVIPGREDPMNLYYKQPQVLRGYTYVKDMRETCESMSQGERPHLGGQRAPIYVSVR